MVNAYQILLFIWVECKYVNMSLSALEEKVTIALMTELQIDHRILIQEPNPDLINVDSFKNYESWTMIVRYKNLEELFQFFVEGSFPDPRTMIVLKVPNLSRIVEFLNNVSSMEKSHNMRKFFWLIIVDWSKSKLEDEKKLLVPYDCEFFILHHPIRSKKFKLREVYKVKDQTVTFDYGTWDENSSLVPSELSWYWRRRNLKNITLVMMGLTYHGEVGTCSTDRQCAHIEFIKCLAIMMNFNLLWIKISSPIEFYFSVKKMDLTDLHTTLTLLDHYRITGEMDRFDLTSPVFTNYINWYIKDPGTKKSSDFYFKPFEADIWISILLTIFIGSLATLTLDFLFKKFTDHNRILDPCDDVFMPLDCLCNQDGGKIRKGSSLRFSKFAIRFLTLFISGAYLGTITSFSTVRIPRLPFQNLKEFLENGDYILGADSLEIHKFFKYSQDPTIHRIKEENRFLTVPNETLYTVDYYTGAHKKICSEKLVYVEYNDEAYSATVSCEVYQIGRPISALGMSAVIPENSPFKEMINLK